MKTNAALRNGYLATPFTPDRTSTGCGVYFATEAERNAFIATFPKWVKVKPCDLRSGGRLANDYGLVWHGSGGNQVSYSADFCVSRLNDVTGAANETGLKRWDRFLAGLASVNIVENLA